ncbi:YjcZ family sporulation protein [Priestia flexa]|uniref:YjcZ family sporulation protein n=1 Tax=Priestia flexa TaxID=86664 RepID=A0A8I1MEP4_9BACI|nr:YjcZ family sporulation protein [Priestia flexa]MBN8251682.1 YjcZ family sporulation protein [Priestia flexa]MBN8434901.1 YjcZ family sporulation protein [Priestia flexa]MCA0967679.1 YjcZ family sporulation protein [Priestia flexa]RIV13363.1 YjcZ family sporulation protein [Priestia flexa]UIR28843.1 YjcZ family sporulation protein [Priestia flexa]
MYNYGCYDQCQYPVGGYHHHCGSGNSFALILVLFILLVIIGCSYIC